MCECEELSDWRLEVFCRGDYDFEWLMRVCEKDCFMLIRSLARFHRLTMIIEVNFCGTMLGIVQFLCNCSLFIFLLWPLGF